MGCGFRLVVLNGYGRPGLWLVGVVNSGLTLLLVDLTPSTLDTAGLARLARVLNNH